MDGKSKTRAGVRAVAIFEVVKSLVVLCVGFGLLSLINHDLAKSAESLVRHLHLNPANKYPRIFIETASHLTNTHLWVIAALALTDSVIRFVVGYGLWYDRYWAKWLGVITAGIYIPLEIGEMAIHFTILKLATFVINVAIVVYLGLVIYLSKEESASVPVPHAT